MDLLLVLAVDASGSIDADEFRLQREGCAEALVQPGRSRGRPDDVPALVTWLLGPECVVPPSVANSALTAA